jgi:outer membrane protease
MIVVKDGKLYVTTQLTNLTTKASVAVFDVKTGETLYEGEVERKDSPENMEEFELNIYEMSVK